MANPTTNYSFVLPTSTDLVTDLPADFDVALQGVDTRLKALQPGTTSGDLAYSSATANTNVRLGIGSTGNVLTVAAGVPSWAAPASASGPAFRAFRNTTNQSFSINTATKVQLNGETFDTDNCFDSTTNFRFTPNKSGYYQMSANLQFLGTSATTTKEIYIYKNSSPVATLGSSAGGPGSPGSAANMGSSTLIFFNGTSDFAELFVYDSDATSRNVLAGSDYTYFTGVWIRS